MNKFFRKYFIFTSGERNGILVLMFLLLILMIAPSIIDILHKPDTADYLKFETEIDSINMLRKAKVEIEQKPVVALFSFDPNTIKKEDLTLLGFTKFQIKNIMRYRSKGGKFHEKKDLKKIYGLDDEFYKRIEPFIEIKLKESKLKIQNLVNNTDNSIDSVKTLVEKEFKDSSNENNSNEKIEQIDINTADSLLLISIIRNNPQLVHRIIKYRELVGGFYSMEQLSEIYGIKNYLIYIENKISVDTNKITKLNINEITFANLNKHPYISYDETKAVFTYLKIMGSFSHVNQLLENNLLTREAFNRIKPYLTIQAK